MSRLQKLHFWFRRRLCSAARRALQKSHLLGQEELANSHQKDTGSSPMGAIAVPSAQSQEMKELVENQRKAEAREVFG